MAAAVGDTTLDGRLAVSAGTGAPAVVSTLQLGVLPLIPVSVGVWACVKCVCGGGVGWVGGMCLAAPS